MKKLFYTTFFILFVLLISCNSNSDNKEQQQPVVLPTTTFTAPVPSAITTDSTININPTLPSAINNTQVTLNPEHGKPGHRCDIAVGAPLTNAPATNTTQTITSANVPANNVDVKPITPNVSEIVPGMNPQHGQPGHRCDIAVGAPLNSKPKQ